jgi:hypothetical protein
MRKFIIAVGAVVIIVAGCAGCGEALNCITFIEGSRVGYVVKFAERGLFSKTYQGEVSMGSVLNGGMGGASPNTWYFSLDNQRRRGEDLESIVAAVNLFLSNGLPVKISYYAPFFTWPWRSSNRYLVQRVEAVSRE